MKNEGKKLTNKKHDLLTDGIFRFLSPPSNFYTKSAKTQSFSRLLISTPDLSNISASYIYEITTNLFKNDELSSIVMKPCVFNFRPVGVV
jgi:hypothetical protein